MCVLGPVLMTGAARVELIHMASTTPSTHSGSSASPDKFSLKCTNRCSTEDNPVACGIPPLQRETHRGGLILIVGSLVGRAVGRSGARSLGRSVGPSGTLACPGSIRAFPWMPRVYWTCPKELTCAGCVRGLLSRALLGEPAWAVATRNTPLHPQYCNHS